VTSLAVWGPTLVMAFAVLSAGVVSLRFVRVARSVRSRYSLISEKGSAALSASLREAESINAYRTDLPGDLSVHLNLSFDHSASVVVLTAVELTAVGRTG
jgi:hypothetical protein